MRVVWTYAARAQVQGIYDYVAADSVGYAKRLVDRIIRRSEQLVNHPESGAIVSEYNSPQVRELFEGPYRIIYRVRVDRLDVIAVIHGARLLPEVPPQ